MTPHVAETGAGWAKARIVAEAPRATPTRCSASLKTPAIAATLGEMNMSRINRSTVVVGLTLLLVGSVGTCADVLVEDARDAQRGAQSRNVRGGAEIEVAARSIRPSLPERLRVALDAAALTQLDGKPVRVTRAGAALFVENATAFSGLVSSSAFVRDIAWRQWPDELVELHSSSSLARRSYRVVIEGDVDGRPFSVQIDRRVPRIETRRDLERALDAAVVEAVRQIGGQ